MKLKTNIILAVFFWVTVFLVTLVDPYLQKQFSPQLVHISTTILFTILIFMWFLADSKAIEYKPSRLLKVGVVVLAVVAIPIYLVKSKGYKRAGLSLLKFLVFFIVLSISFFVVELFNA